MPSTERRIENIEARLRELQRELADARAAALRPASWIRAGSGGQILIKTPSGGIPAATGSGPYTWGSATCTKVSTAGVVGTDTVEVKNIVNQTIAGDVVGKAARVGDIWVIDVASCGSGEE